MNVQDYIDKRLVHEIHTSERRSFRGCRRRWDWIFRQNFYPRKTAPYFEFGVAYHQAMEVYYSPDTWNWPRDTVAKMAEAAFIAKCKAQKAKYLEAEGTSYLPDDVEEDYKERMILGRGMLKYYFEKIAPKEDIGWKPIRVEVEFIVDIPHPETGETIWCKCPVCFDKWCKWIAKGAPGGPWPDNVSSDQFVGLPVVYAGRLDVLAQDEHGTLWIIDWKTARTITDNYQFLYLDDQVGSYPWALNRLGLKVGGFIYHQQRKGYPQEPKRNKSQRLGCWYSVNKNQDVDYATYLATIQEHDHDAWKAGYYDEMLRYLQEEGIIYFSRHQIHKTDAELDEIGRNIGLEALDMVDPDIRIYPSSGRFSCDSCAFQTPCIEKNSRSDYEYALDTMFEKREHYYIRAEPSTESKGAE